MVDLTDVKGLFGIVTFKVAVVFDAFSRMPLSARVFSKEASAAEIARLVSRTARRHGRPSHFVSDQGRCFTGQVFRRKLRRLGVKQRFGAIGKKGSIALIERLWRTLKDTFGLRLLRPLVAQDLMEKIELGPRPLRPLPPASGARRCDAGRDLLRPDARASLSDPASPRQAGRSPNGSAGTGSTSSLKSGHPGETSVDVCAHGGIVVTEALVCARQRPPQFPLRPYSTQELVSGEYA